MAAQDSGIEGDLAFIGDQHELLMGAMKGDIGDTPPLNMKRLTREQSRRRARFIRHYPEERQRLVEQHGEEEVVAFEEKYG